MRHVPCSDATSLDRRAVKQQVARGINMRAHVHDQLHRGQGIGEIQPVAEDRS